MGKLRFDVSADLVAVIAHSKANPCREPYTGNPAEAGLLLVKDSGVYLMSAAKPPLIAPDGESNLVVYADGHDPREGSTWEQDRAVCGGDDFAQFLPLRGSFEEARVGDRLEVRLNKNSISIILRPK